MELTTDRLIIRPFAPEDLPAFTRLLDIPELPYWGMQRDNAQGFLAWYIAHYKAMDIVRGVVCFGIFHREDGRVLGACGAGEHDDLHETEIFYNLLPGERGCGYATEAARAVTAWALSNAPIPAIIGTVAVDNGPSRRVLERCGYRFIDERELLVHITGERYAFRYYRYDRKPILP